MEDCDFCQHAAVMAERDALRAAMKDLIELILVLGRRRKDEDALLIERCRSTLLGLAIGVALGAKAPNSSRSKRKTRNQSEG